MRIYKIAPLYHRVPLTFSTESYYDMREFARRCTEEQAHYVDIDPLVLSELKAHLFKLYPLKKFILRSVQ